VRVVSLIPSATEIVAALGRESLLAGRSHECDFPASVGAVPALTASRIPEGLSSAGIDDEVRKGAREGGPLYRIDRDALAAARPDVIITQELCEVCAVSLDEVQEIADALPGDPRVLSLGPQTLDGVLASIEVVGAVIGAADEARQLAGALRSRVERVRAAVVDLPMVRVVSLEWLDPPYSAGHWVPDQVGAAGGVEVIGRRGRQSRRIKVADVLAAGPEAILVIPCGFDLSQAAAEWRRAAGALVAMPAARGGRVLVADASSCFSRPGPRLVDGVEALAAALHPEAGLPEASGVVQALA
jgi:iron complex transport system substrate-binding protein